MRKLCLESYILEVDEHFVTRDDYSIPYIKNSLTRAVFYIWPQASGDDVGEKEVGVVVWVRGG